MSTLRRRRPKGRQQRVTGIIVYKLDQAAEMLCMSEHGVRALIKRGECPSVRVGRLLRIPAVPFHKKFGEATGS